ncbi:MAG: 2-hydroxyacid dehydrogenase [Betaproteobacteria bacterium]
MRPELLVTGPIYAPTLAELEKEYTLHRLWTAPEREAFLREVANGVRGVVTGGLFGCSRELMNALPRLEIIACFGNPRGTVDLAHARERGIVATNTPDSISAAVADLAVGLMIAVMRRIVASDRYVRAGKWRAGPAPVGRDLGRKTCGIVGLGKIGGNIARRAEAFGMTVCYHARHRKEGAPYDYCPDLAEMAQRSDCLILACPLTPETRGLVNARILDGLGPEGFLVNVARGPVVDQSALVEALQQNRIAGAGLDVFWDEPDVPEALAAMEHVVLQPHMGSSIVEVREERGKKLLANLHAHFAGKPVLTPM